MKGIIILFIIIFIIKFLGFPDWYLYFVFFFGEGLFDLTG